MNITRLTHALFAIGVTCCLSHAAQASLIVNGGFEQPTLSAGFSIFPSIPGWTGGPQGIEIQQDGVGSYTASGIADGEQFVELDARENSLMFQDVPTQAGQTYRLSFAFAPRQLDTRPLDSNDVAVVWEGVHVALLGGPSVPAEFRQEPWEIHTYELLANSGSGLSRLQFEARGASDSKGGLLDRVSLVQVPEPSTTVLLALGIGAAVIRFRTRFVEL